jgi:hypothetical protein
MPWLTSRLNHCFPAAILTTWKAAWPWLEQIVRTTTAGMERILQAIDAQRVEFRTSWETLRTEQRGLQERFERRLDLFGATHRSDFRRLPGVMLAAGCTTLPGAFGAMLGAMAQGFHWL